MENNQTKKITYDQRKHRRKKLTWIALALLVVLLAVMPVLAENKNAEKEQQASILSGKVEYGSIDTKIVGGGRLASEAAIKLEIPEAVKLTEYLVGNGDTVSKGDPVAMVDRVSVMTAITGVQQTLDELSKEIAAAESKTDAGTVNASAGGRIKVIYAEAGEAVQDVMMEHGALAAIALDDVMAVQIQRPSTLGAGDKVCVTLPDGTEVDGRVEKNLEGILTITVKDKNYAVGTAVTVKTEDGDRLGKGTLYIFNQWNAVAYSGTVSHILVAEGASMYKGQPILQISDSGHTAEFQRLIDKRQEYEELMQELFQMYRTQSIAAPCDGIVSGVDKDGAFLLADHGDGFVISLLSNLAGQRKDLFAAYGAQVQAVSEEGMTLAVSIKRNHVEDLGNLAAIGVNPAKLQQTWDYVGDTTVYVQSADGLLRADGRAEAGDVLLAVGDAENVLWFVRAEPQDGQSNAADRGYRMILLSAITEEETPAITLDISNTQGTAKSQFDAQLKATQDGTVLSGTWVIESSGFPMNLYGDMLYGVPEKAGEYTVTVGFVPDEAEEGTYISATFPLAIVSPYEIVTQTLPEGVVGEEYRFTMQVSGSTTGEWYGENLAGLVINQQTGEISGKPLMSGSFEATIKYKDPNKRELTKVYQLKITAAKKPEQSGNLPNGMGGGMVADGGKGNLSGSMPSGMTGGAAGGMTGMGGAAQQEDPYYSLEKLTIASVTSQEQMTVDITIDELDITKIYIGQTAAVTMDALAGESFTAKVSKIANSGENEGGNSKFMVELTLDKSGDMLPGMTASAVIRLNTVEDALCIPVAALSEEHGKTLVYTSYDPEKGLMGGPVEVSLGVADAEHVQILGGLEEGMTFYYAYYDTLAEEAMPAMGAMPFR